MHNTNIFAIVRHLNEFSEIEQQLLSKIHSYCFRTIDFKVHSKVHLMLYRLGYFQKILNNTHDYQYKI